jgi:hypothetical protein
MLHPLWLPVVLGFYNYLCTYDLYSPCIMFWMHAYPLRGEVGGGWALEFESFLGPLKWHQAYRRVPFGVQKTRAHTGGGGGEAGE